MKKKNFPAPVITSHDGFLVVRDDLIAGGTKRRALTELLGNITAHEVVYPATAYGYGQLALAYAGMDTGKKVTLFLAARSDFSKTPLVREVMEKTNAQYQFVPYPNFMNVVQARARAYCEETGAKLLPLGFNTPEFSAILTRIAKGMNINPPKEVWLAGGTGTLARALSQAWPQAKIHAVSLGMRNGDMGNAIVHEAPEKFEQKAKNPPPFPSASHYDAKVWQFAKAHGKKGALIWNVGK